MFCPGEPRTIPAIKSINRHRGSDLKPVTKACHPPLLTGELTQMVADEDASGEAPAGSEFQQLGWELPVGFRLGEVPLT